MNEWPVGPGLDDRLRRLMAVELEAARADVVGLALRRRRHSDRSSLNWAAAGILAVAAITGALILRGANLDGRPIGAPSESSNSTATTPSGTFSRTGTPITADIRGAVTLPDGRVLVYGVEPASPQLYDGTTGKFIGTGRALRAGPAGPAARLADGRILFVGGMSDSKTIAFAQLYDPATGTFRATGSPLQDRFGHTATLLADGRVLIAGGGSFDGSGSPADPVVLASAEIYDPATGRFVSTGDMTVGRRDASATRLADGRVLIAGGASEGNNPLRSAEIYDPATGRFTATGSMITGRYAFTSILLRDGRVLVVGGFNPQHDILTLEIFDPRTGMFSAAGELPRQGGPSAISLADGRVLIVGGSEDLTPEDGSALGSVRTVLASVFDPATNQTAATGSLRIARTGPTLALLRDGRVLVAGGGGPRDTAELYVP